MSKSNAILQLRHSLTAHLQSKGDRIHAKYGPDLGWDELQLLLNDKECVRYPCEIRFDSGPLLPGEFAHPLPKGPQPESGFVICVHPVYAGQPEQVSRLVLYQLVLVNYGDIATAEDAEIFGAHALGLPREEYYRSLCELAAQLESNAS